MLSFPLSIPGSGCPPSCEARCNRGASRPATLAQRLKDLLRTGSSKTARVPEATPKGQRGLPGPVPFVSTGGEARAELSEWYQHPVRGPARADPPASRSLKAVLSLGLPVLSHETQQGTHTLDLEALPLPTTRDHPGPQRIHHCVHPPPTCTHTCTHNLYTHGMHHTVYMPMCTRNMNTQKAYIKFAHTQYAYMYTQRCTQNRYTHYAQCGHTHVHTMCTCNMNTHKVYTQRAHAHTWRSHAAQQHIQHVLRV